MVARLGAFPCRSAPAAAVMDLHGDEDLYNFAGHGDGGAEEANSDEEFHDELGNMDFHPGSDFERQGLVLFEIFNGFRAFPG